MTEYLFVSDLDGTLFDAEAKITTETATMLNEFIEEGLNFTVATGKSFCSIQNQVCKLDLQLPIVCYDGACTRMSNGDIINCNFVDKNIVSQALEVFIKSNCNVLLFYLDNDFLTENVGIYLQNEEDKYIKRFVKNRQGRTFTYFQKEPNTLDLFFLGTVGSYDKICSLKNALLLHGIRSVNLNADTYEKGMYWLKVSNPLSKKYIAVSDIMRMASLRKVVVFGDGENDLDLFERADISIAVKNASVSIKQKADVIIKKNTDNAVARYIDSILKRGSFI